MLTTSWAIKAVVVATVLSGISVIGFAEIPAPTQIDLASGRRVQQKENRLYEVDASEHKISVIQLPPAFKRAIATSSSIAFPDDHSRLVS